MKLDFDIIVVGAGPAGAATAVGLKRLGYRVAVISKPRHPKTWEGFSSRVVGALKSLELTHTLSTLSIPIPRKVNWGDKTDAANVEFLVDRSRFDRGLLTDLRNKNIEVFESACSAITMNSDYCVVNTESDQQLFARFIVEARGRATPARMYKTSADQHSGIDDVRAANTQKHRGPKSIVAVQRWLLPKAREPGIFVGCFASGWYWLASAGGKEFITQTCISADAVSGENKHFAQQWHLALPADSPGTEYLRIAKPKDETQFKGSTAILHSEVVGTSFIRVGDAAMAVDPLSGNGVFQTLSSALAAPAVINTILRRPQDAQLAARFYRARLEHLFWRFARMGRDFYQMYKSPNAQTFWRERQQWPDLEPAHSETDAIVGIETRPVINEGFIEAKEVLVTLQQPLGIWLIDGEPAADRYRKRKTKI